MTARTLTKCQLCPAAEPAATRMIDANSEVREVCLECAFRVWAGDWQAIRASVLDYQMHTATRWDWLRHGRRSRRVAKGWARAVERLMKPEQINFKEGPSWLR